MEKYYKNTTGKKAKADINRIIKNLSDSSIYSVDVKIKFEGVLK